MEIRNIAQTVLDSHGNEGSLVEQSCRRLGFSIRAMGLPDVTPAPVHSSNPLALGSSLMRLRDIILYCSQHKIRMYRMHCNLAPQLSHGEQTGGIWRIYQQEAELLAELVREQDVRLSFHPYSLVSLSTPDEDRAWRSAAYLESQSTMLDMLQLSREAVIVLHVGGIYDELTSARDRFIRRYEQLQERVRQRLALENDDRRFSIADIINIHDRCGIPLVFDWQHHQVLNPLHIPWQEALTRCIASWPDGITPKIHFSSPRTELRSENGHIKVPSWTEHSDYVQPFEFIYVMRSSVALPFDVMLECKARDLALLKLRQDLKRFAPELAIQ